MAANGRFQPDVSGLEPLGVATRSSVLASSLKEGILAWRGSRCTSFNPESFTLDFRQVPTAKLNALRVNRGVRVSWSLCALSLDDLS